jgi:translation elongation factor aEF-1 beta
MARVILTLTIMPSSPETDLNAIEAKAKEAIVSFTDDDDTEFKIEQKPVAFGLKSLNVTFVMDEDKGGTEEVEKKIASLENVNSAEITDVRRAIG